MQIEFQYIKPNNSSLFGFEAITVEQKLNMWIFEQFIWYTSNVTNYGCNAEQKCVCVSEISVCMHTRSSVLTNFKNRKKN